MSNLIQTCCVFKCINTPSNSKVKFFSLPEPRLRIDQRNKWVEAIQNQNGQWWVPNASSVICSEHFQKGLPSNDLQDTDYVPSVFINRRKVHSRHKSRALSLKRFALEYMQQEELLERPSRSNVNTKRRRRAYMRLRAALSVSLTTAKAWETGFRRYFEEKLADPEHKWEPAADGTPHWKTTVQKRLYANPLNRLTALGFGGAVTAHCVVEALCAAARARGTLCSTAMYQDVRRALRLSSAISDLHAVWVSAQRVSLAQVELAARAGDAGPPAPRSAADVADLVLLHSDVDMHRLVTDESVTLYEEASALHTLWQLVQQHQLEEAAHSATHERALRWARAHREYLASGRTASLVVLQRRWYELKLQARVSLATHWRRAPAPDAPPPPPRPAPLHIAILKRYPHVATGPFKCWREQVLDGSVVIEPLEEENDLSVKQSQDSELSSACTAPGDEPAAAPAKLEVPKEEQNTDSDTSSQESAIKRPKIEQSLNLLFKGSSSEDLAEQRTVDDYLAEHLTVNKLFDESKVKQYTVKRRTVNAPLADNAAGRASIAPATAVDQIHPDEHETLPPVPERANGSETDTDTEDNLVIDECSDTTPCSLKQEPDAHTESHSGDTVSPHAVLGNLAPTPTPTIQVLHMIDPSTVKTEILFESDEDDFQPYNELDKDEIELSTKKEASFISNRIVFADEEPGGSCDVTTPPTLINRMDSQNEQKVDIETPNFDPKLLMDASVPLFRIDKTRVWRHNVRKDNSIRVSRIHRRYYTPKHKNKICNENQSTTQEISVDTSCLDKVADTDSIRQLCTNIKREMVEEQPEVPKGNTPLKKAKPESDSEDDQPLLKFRKEESRDRTDDAEDAELRELVKESGDTTDDAEDADVRELIEESSSDDELVNMKMLKAVRGRGARWKAHGRSAASTIEWAAAYSPVFGRVAKRVSLPDMEQVRRLNSGMRVAQVAPITSATSACGEDVPVEQPLGDAAHTDTPLAWRALELPAQHELQAALDELTRASSAEQTRAHCCEARRQREVNDTQRRFGLPDVKQHTHADGSCTCCCAHLSDASARRRLDAQLRALHDDIERMLGKSAEGRSHSKPKPSRSPSPARASTSATAPIAAPVAHNQAARDSPSNTTTTFKRSKAKPATYTNRSKRDRRGARAPAPPPPPVDDYEEWQRQKNLNAQYFHIDSKFFSKKDKSTARVSVVQSTTTQRTVPSTTTQDVAVPSTTTQAIPVLSAWQDIAVPSTIMQVIAVPSTTTQDIAVPSTTTQHIAVPGTSTQAISVPSTATQATPVQSASQDIAVPSTIMQVIAVPSTTTQDIAVPSTTTQHIAVPGTSTQAISVPSTATQATPVQSASQDIAVPSTNQQSAQGAQSGLMPYIRESRLIAPVSAPPAPELWSRRQSDKPVRIAPRPDNMPRPEDALLARHKTVTQKPATAKERSKDEPPLPVRAPAPLSLSTEQVPVPAQAGSVSLLEQYSRSLPAGAAPLVNALSLRAPASAGRSRTTIVMALTLPAERDASVDLTEEADDSNSDVTKSVQKTSSPVLDIVGVVKSLMNPVSNSVGDRNLLKFLSNKPSGNSLLRAIINSPSDEAPHAPGVVSACKGLRDGDFIEIEDSDSNHSDGAYYDGYIPVNNSSNPAVYTNKSSNQTKSSNTKKSSDQTTNKADDSLNQAAATKNDETVCKTSPASEANGSAGAADGPTATSSIPVNKTKNKRIRIRPNRYLKPANLLKSSSDEVNWHMAMSACSRIPELEALTDADGAGRCPARRADPAAMPALLQQLRRAHDARQREVYCYKLAAPELAVSVLPCGGTLLCVDGARVPLVLPARDGSGQRGAAPSACAHLVLSDAELPCALPTYWSLAGFARTARVVPGDTAPQAPGPRGPVVAAGEEDPRPICEKKHNFKILTAFCSADGVRQAARAGATLFLLNVLRARVFVLSVTRVPERGCVRHHTSADVAPDLLHELEAMLDDAEVDEELGGRADDTDQ